MGRRFLRDTSELSLGEIPENWGVQLGVAPDLVNDLIGSCDEPADLSANKNYMEGLGK